MVEKTVKSSISILIVSLLLGNEVITSPVKNEETPCTQICNAVLDETKINVHLVPHSHDDVGWLKTVDQYYYGSRRDIQDAGVQYIISSYVDALKANPERKFIQVETAFFWKWWQNQSNVTREDFVNLVNSGQIEIVNGGWSMNDEAATNYQSIIDQFTWGFRKLDETVGQCSRPKIGWQIDPFGHSREHASLIKQLGFDALIIGRIDHDDKNQRIKNRALDFLWKTSDNLDDSELFTSMFPDIYTSIGEFNWDVTNRGENAPPPINDDESSPDFNLPDNVKKFAGYMDAYKDLYKTKNIFVPMGGDFNYQAAEMNFLNMDKLIKGFEDDATYNVFYSSPSCYVKAVNDEIVKDSIELPTKALDFFPYSSDAHSFWAGYFTSRPTAKKFERTGNNILQVAKQLAAFTKIIKDEDLDESLVDLREAMGILQHHDAITGTAKQAVANDYVRIMTRAIESAEKSMSSMISSLLDYSKDFNFKNCLLSNISICENTGKDQFWVSVYNPSGQAVSHYVRLPVDDFKYKVTARNDNALFTVDLVDSISDFKYVDLGPDHKIHPKELVFLAKEIPPMGIKLYHVEKQLKSSIHQEPNQKEGEVPTEYGNENVGFTINSDSGLLATVTIKGVKLNVEQQFFYYDGFSGDNHDADNRASGAYVFRPETSEKKAVSAEKPIISGFRGELIDEFRQIFNEEVTQIIRVYKNNASNFIEFDWLVGDLQIADGKNGKEIVTEFKFKDFENKNIFYTDSNGREQIRREVNKREDYEYDSTAEPVASNYYPITSKIVLKDEEKKLEVAVLNDRAQGGTSLNDGEIELMVHRRLHNDDAFGVNEPLNEEEFGNGLFVRGQHLLTFGSSESKVDKGISTAAFERIMAQQKLTSPWVMVADASAEGSISLEKVEADSKVQFSGLSKNLPFNINILTFEPWADDTYILRLEHFLEKGEDQTLSADVTVNFEKIFTEFDIIEAKETILGANLAKEIFNKEDHFKWNEKKESGGKMHIQASDSIVLKPMEIKTFLVRIGPKKDDDNEPGHGVIYNPSVIILVISSILYLMY